jgi:hypothetical protein
MSVRDTQETFIDNTQPAGLDIEYWGAAALCIE